MKIVGVIPSRYESTRFFGKPLVDLEGKPMIWWVYDQCNKVKGLDGIYVATDSKKIESVCKRFDLNVIMTSCKHQTGTDRLGEVAERIEADYYINIQGDEPLIEPDVIEKIINRCCQEDHPKIVNSVTPIIKREDILSNSCVKVVIDANKKGLYLSRSPIPFPKNGQEITYMKHLGLYGLSRDALLFYSNTPRGKIEQIEDVEMLRFLENGYSIDFVQVESETIAIDKPEDADRVREIIRIRKRAD